MFELSIKSDFDKWQKSLMAIAGEHMKAAAAVALNRMAVAARAKVMEELPKVFDRPVPFTMHAIRYGKATADNLAASVYISEDGKSGFNPRKYLAAEIMGGTRRDKRSEVVLHNAGILLPGEQTAPGEGMVLDAFGNIPGSRMTQMLSRVSAFHQMGFDANATAKTRRRLKRMKLSVVSTKTDYFVGKDKRSGEPQAIYQLFGKGDVAPVLWFVHKRPTYNPRFDFGGMVELIARERWPDEMWKALLEELNRH